MNTIGPFSPLDSCIRKFTLEACMYIYQVDKEHRYRWANVLRVKL